MGWQSSTPLLAFLSGLSNLVVVRYSFCCIKASASLLLRRGGAGVTLLLFLVNSVARQNFVGKTNAQPIFTTTTTGPMVMQDVARINGVHLVQAHLHLRWGGGSKTS